MTTYIVACDYDEYWVPIAATDDEETAEAILDAASAHIIERLRAKHAETNEGDNDPLPFDEARASEIAASALKIAPSKPPFVSAGTPMLPDEVRKELDEQIDEFELLEAWL